jgi:hypothetical protein
LDTKPVVAPALSTSGDSHTVGQITAEGVIYQGRWRHRHAGQVQRILGPYGCTMIAADHEYAGTVRQCSRKRLDLLADDDEGSTHPDDRRAHATKWVAALLEQTRKQGYGAREPGYGRIRTISAATSTLLPLR